jgi:hypothetical protein
MDASEGSIWFLGDLSDPWVDAIAGALAFPNVIRLDCRAELPEQQVHAAHPPRLIVVHRHHLTHRDGETLKSWREPRGNGPRPGLILCVSPYARFEEVEQWLGLVDIVLPEATATDVLPRHVVRLLKGREDRKFRVDGSTFRIEVAVQNGELSGALVEACRAIGHQVEAVDDREIGELVRIGNGNGTTLERVLTIWELPVLEPGWTERLERHSRQTGPVIGLVGFADRTLVTSAKESGAIACLELPCDLDDLLDIIERKAGNLPLDTWPLPIRIEPPHVLPPPPRRRNQRAAVGKASRTHSQEWSD